MKQYTDFGYETIDKEDKVNRVAEVFDSVADRYDLMNDLLSFGIHRYWKNYCIYSANINSNDKILDLAGGTGDMTSLIYPKLKDGGEIVLADINANMLQAGRNRLIDEGYIKNISYLQADAENLPIQDNYFDLVIIAFGLRNVTDKIKALKSMYRVLKAGGKLQILEFSQPNLPILNEIYDAYSFNILPILGKIIVNDSKSYKYLAESIRKHPKQEQLKQMMLEVGLEDCQYQNLNSGIVALHCGYKY